MFGQGILIYHMFTVKLSLMLFSFFRDLSENVIQAIPRRTFRGATELKNLCVVFFFSDLLGVRCSNIMRSVKLSCLIKTVCVYKSGRMVNSIGKSLFELCFCSVSWIKTTSAASRREHSELCGCWRFCKCKGIPPPPHHACFFSLIVQFMSLSTLNNNNISSIPVSSFNHMPKLRTL